MAFNLKSALKIVNLTSENEDLRKRFGWVDEIVKLEPDGWILWAKFRKYGDQYRDFQVIVTIANNY